ncbi:unnamed protein product [Clonostachys chloroleuca]|uniref:DUF676 domain-containing protein n=1 Tax=Clonostachys chloroleuca TaxID=1926264 RepID=A0AA35M4C6_9HYPO|nr:unnamed protein product [Clonostachys chloroleuca]
MLLVYQTGSVKVGEVVRYTVTYTPSRDRILPSPEKLYVRIRNTCAIALRAAFVHGPYTLSVAAYPSNFNPNERFANPRRYGIPEFEPMLKAGGSWEGELTVPDDVRQSAGTGAHGGFGKGPGHEGECASWVIEVSSQILFSTSAAVAYEVIVARDRKSLDLGGVSLPVVSGQSKVPQPGKLEDYQQHGTTAAQKNHQEDHHSRGVFSRAVQLKVEDTEALWNTPRAPVWKDKKKKKEAEAAPGEPAGGSEDHTAESKSAESKSQEGSAPRVRQKKVHLVILTHGLHSNLGADMLFLKESIDAAVKQAKIDAKKRRAKERAERQASEAKSESGVSQPDSANGDGTSEKADQVNVDDDFSDDEDEDEEVIVRGYSGNATKTERGIKYLGKKLARYVLSNTYPDQPYLPLGKGVPAPYTTQDPKNPKDPKDAKAEGEVPEDKKQHGTGHPGSWHGHHPQIRPRSFKITSISFIAHSLGGLVQTYAVAYIQKHSPEFFNLIKPINFIALATPFLGLSNENPMYVKFALDFGLVGRTGKDLGLAWRAPTLARSGWGAIVGNLGETAHKKVYGESQPESKPLLRILPTGPAHTALKKFRNRTVYSNVVNDGIVPLRTSCLLFLDWYGLGRVEKARRDAGLVETVVGFGWAELTGTSMANSRQRQLLYDEPASVADGTESPKETGEDMRQVPQPSEDAVQEDERASISSVRTPYSEVVKSENGEGVGGPFSSFFNLFKNNDPPKEEPISEKQKRIYSMSQTLQITDDSSSAVASSDTEAPPRPMMVTTGHELEEDEGGMKAPPRTTVFESAGDLLNPKIPDMDYILDPAKRPRTIFHDRVYHPTDIPAPPIKAGTSPSVRRRLSRVSTWGSSQKPPTVSSQSSSSSKQEPLQQPLEDSENSADTAKRRDSESSTMRVEEKIARAYHYDLSWRKVLVKLEPDAHNNIFVRRMFANAYGWPVVKHIVDAHFSDSALARMRTEDDFLGELSKDVNQPPDEHGGETISTPRLTANLDNPQSPGTETDAQEALDKVSNLPESYQEQPRRFQFSRADSVTWSDRDWVDSENESDLDSTAESKAKAKAKKKEEQQQQKEEGGSSASTDWNWKEKIVGKGKKKKGVSLSSEGSKASTIDKR